MAVYHSMEQLIGNTPLLELARTKEALSLSATLYAKLESFNPAGSVKDRVGLEMILEAERQGTLTPGATIIEPTSGNTGIGLAAVAAVRGYQAIIVMPENMSKERQLLISAYGAKLVLTPAQEGMMGAIKKARELQKELPNSMIAGQFENPANPKAHHSTTGPEIFADTKGEVDLFVSGIGTGGTITGVGRYLKENNPNIQIIGVEPEDSPFLTKQESGPHPIQGIGAGFLPEVLDLSVVDKIYTVSKEEAKQAVELLAKTEGVLAGISSGAALAVALRLAALPKHSDKKMVVLLPDTGERYLSTWLYE